MKTLLIITVFFVSRLLQAQETFYDVYNAVLKIQTKFSENYKSVHGTRRDTIERGTDQSQEVKEYYEELDKQLDNLVNKNFPDISFTGLNNESYVLSDFPEELVVNYNYPYCMSCINRIDSTQKWTDKKNIRILVLFSEVYKKDISFLKPFNDNVLIGFINEDVIDLISMRQGDDCMYLLDKTNRIEFFDKHDHKAWTEFLSKKFSK